HLEHRPRARRSAVARPFVGAGPDSFRRTANRRDYAVPAPEATILDLAAQAGRDVVSVGKIADIFAHRGTGRVLKAEGNGALCDRTLEGTVGLADGGLLFVNFIDFGRQFAHRRDVAGYAAALEAFDACLPELTRGPRAGDSLIIIAVCDPTWPR